MRKPSRARDRQIHARCLAAVLTSDDVINGKSEPVDGLGKVAVFASSLRSRSYPPLEVYRYGHGAHDEVSASVNVRCAFLIGRSRGGRPP